MESELEYFEEPMFKNGRIALLEKVLEELILGSKNKSEAMMLVNTAIVEFNDGLLENKDVPKEWKGGVEEGVSQVQLLLKKLQVNSGL